jgi:hypothetical protein
VLVLSGEQGWAADMKMINIVIDFESELNRNLEFGEYKWLVIVGARR